MTTRRQGMAAQRIRVWTAVSAVALGVGSAQVMAAEEASAPAPTAQEGVMIQDGMDVTMDYALTVDGVVVDSSEGKEAFRYRHGTQQIIPGLEKALVGLKVGDAKEVTVLPEDGYGQYEAGRVIEVSKDQMPSDIGLEVGMVLGGVDAEGRPIRGTIKEIKDKAVVMDMNHPLAGKTLHFKVKITEIKPSA